MVSCAVGGYSNNQCWRCNRIQAKPTTIPRTRRRRMYWEIHRHSVNSRVVKFSSQPKQPRVMITKGGYSATFGPIHLYCVCVNLICCFFICAKRIWTIIFVHIHLRWLIAWSEKAASRVERLNFEPLKWRGTLSRIHLFAINFKSFEITFLKGCAYWNRYLEKDENQFGKELDFHRLIKSVKTAKIKLAVVLWPQSFGLE